MPQARVNVARITRTFISPTIKREEKDAYCIDTTLSDALHGLSSVIPHALMRGAKLKLSLRLIQLRRRLRRRIRTMVGLAAGLAGADAFNVNMVPNAAISTLTARNGMLTYCPNSSTRYRSSQETHRQHIEDGVAWEFCSAWGGGSGWKGDSARNTAVCRSGVMSTGGGEWRGLRGWVSGKVGAVSDVSRAQSQVSADKLNAFCTSKETPLQVRNKG